MCISVSARHINNALSQKSKHRFSRNLQWMTTFFSTILIFIWNQWTFVIYRVWTYNFIIHIAMLESHSSDDFEYCMVSTHFVINSLFGISTQLFPLPYLLPYFDKRIYNFRNWFFWNLFSLLFFYKKNFNWMKKSLKLKYTAIATELQ